MESQQIILLTQAREAITKARSIDDLRDIRDKAEAIRQYAKARGECFEIQQQAAEIKVRAERRAGEMLAEMPKHDGGRPAKKTGHTVLPVSTLSDIGVEKMQSARWQRIASVPEPEFESHLESAKASGREITTAGVMSLAKHTANASRNTETTAKASSSDDLSLIIESGQKFSTIYADPPWQYGNQADRAVKQLQGWGERFPATMRCGADLADAIVDVEIVK